MEKYSETLIYLYEQLPMFHRLGKAAYKADLDNTIKILNLLNNPQKNFTSIHIAGTNGKGSTSHLLASIFQEAGYKTGLYTSPHLKDFRERVKINGEFIPENYIVEFVNKNKIEFEKIAPSFFEWTVGLAFNYFSDERVDIAIIETGLGGRLDSTNLIEPIVSVITNIGMDHMDLLGDTLPKIAFEKAGIIKKTIPVVIGETDIETKDVFINKAIEQNCNIYFADENFKVVQFSQNFDFKNAKLEVEYLDIKNNKTIVLRSPLAGIYQLKNFKTVLQTINTIETKRFKISEENILNGIGKVIENTGLLGRWQILGTSPLIVADTAHNEHGIVEIIGQIKQIKYTKLHLVLGFVKEKEIEKILEMFPKNAKYYFCKPDIPRGMELEKIVSISEKMKLDFQLFNSVNEAYLEAKKNANQNDLVYCGGSTFVVAEIL